MIMKLLATNYPVVSLPNNCHFHMTTLPGRCVVIDGQNGMINWIKY